MRLFQWSLSLGMLSYVVFGVFRRSRSPLETSFGIQGLAVWLLLILPVVGTVLGVMIWNRKEVKAWWVIGVIVLNIDMILTGIFLLFPG
jgi:cytochrome bd-type quinol oxidase subunit 2